jgi:hypothetical protein
VGLPSRITHPGREDRAGSGVGRSRPANAHLRRGRHIAPDESRLISATEGVNAPYRLEVIASNVADVVASAGGWLFDRMRAGWRVNIHAADHWDVRPLRILGIGTVPFDWDLEAMTSPQPQALAVSAEVYRDDARVRESVGTALDGGLIELSLWGDTDELEIFPNMLSMKHRLSRAARVFKSYSLVAASVPHISVDTTESFLVHCRLNVPADIQLARVGTYSPWVGDVDRPHSLRGS